MARLVSIVFCGLLVALPLVAQETPPAGLETATPRPELLPLGSATAQQLEDQGDALRAQNFFLDAADSYKAAIRKQPTAALYNKLGITYIMLRRFPDAYAALHQSIRMQKNYADAWNNVGSIYYIDGDYRRAEKDFERAIKINPKNASYHSNLGAAEFNRKDLRDAAREIQIALQLDPFVFERSSKSGIAALMGRPTNDRAHFEYLIAKLFAQDGDANDAILHLRKAMEEGYKDIKDVYKDQEFATVRTDQRFKDLMAQKIESIPQ